MTPPTQPPGRDEYGLFPSDRRAIRVHAVKAAGHAMSGTSYQTTGSQEMSIVIVRVASRMEQFILDGE